MRYVIIIMAYVRALIIVVEAFHNVGIIIRRFKLMNCPKCNHDNANDATFCQGCGAPLNNVQNTNVMAQVTSGKGAGIAALVLGIVSCVFAWVAYVSILALILSIVGLILAVKGKKTAPANADYRGIITAGLVLSIIGLVLSAIGFITCTLPAIALCGAVSSLPGLYY